MADPQPSVFQKPPSACKAPDTGWFFQPGWDSSGRTEVSSALGLWAACLGCYSSFTPPNKLGKAAQLPQCEEGNGGTANRGSLSTSPLLPVRCSLSTHLRGLALVLVSPDLTCPCYPLGLRLMVIPISEAGRPLPSVPQTPCSKSSRGLSEVCLSQGAPIHREGLSGRAGSTATAGAQMARVSAPQVQERPPGWDRVIGGQC